MSRSVRRGCSALACAVAPLVLLPSAALAGARDVAIARADAALAAQPQMSLAAPGDRFRVKDVMNDPSGAAHVRYSRTHHGISVLGGDLVVHLKASGKLESMTVAQQAPITTDVQADRSAAAARAGASSRFSGKVDHVAAASLVIDATQPKPVLVHDVVVSGTSSAGTPSTQHVLTDADSGKLVDRWDAELDLAAQGTAKTHYSGVRTIRTTVAPGGYQLIEPLYGNTKVCDAEDDNAENSCANAPTDAQPFFSTTNVWGDSSTNGQTAGADVFFGIQSASKLLDQWFARPGVFLDGTPLTAWTNMGTWAGARYVPADTVAGLGPIMKFGDGASGSGPFTSLDVVAHELGHGLVDATADLAPGGETAALNEAFGDVLGTLTEWFATDASSPDPADWTIAEQVRKNGISAPMRYMYQPSLNGTGKDCYTADIGTLDPHYGSGPFDKFFFMLAEGSTDSDGAGPDQAAPTCGAPDVVGIGRYDAAQIWYTALTRYMVSTTGYQATGGNDARAATLSAARDLYGKCSTQYRAVQAAWTATNVAGEDVGCPTIGVTDAIQVSDTEENVITNIRNFGKSSTVTIKYGTTTAYGSTQTVSVAAVDRSTVSFPLTGLTPGTVYHYEITNTTSEGTAVLSGKSFVTSALPQVTVTGASSVSQTSHAVNWSGNTFGRSGTLKVDYGTTSSFGSTATTSIPVNGTAGFSGTTTLTGLTSGTVYYYKVTVTTTRGTSVTTTKSFVTQAPPQVSVIGSSTVSPTSQSVSWTGNSFGLAGTLKVDYGLTTSYGSTVTKAISGTGTGSFTGSSSLSGLTTGRTYNYRLTLTTSAGTAVTTNKTFVAGA